jgi:hypothetical protein
MIFERIPKYTLTIGLNRYKLEFNSGQPAPGGGQPGGGGSQRRAYPQGQLLLLLLPRDLWGWKREAKAPAPAAAVREKTKGRLTWRGGAACLAALSKVGGLPTAGDGRRGPDRVRDLGRREGY